METVIAEVLLSICAGGFGWCAAHVYGLRTLRAQRYALKEAERDLRAKEQEICDQIERALMAQSKIDGDKVRLLLTQRDCPNCGNNGSIVREPRCYGQEGVCPRWQVHQHARCVSCRVEWIECGMEVTLEEITKRNKEKR